MIIWRIFQVYSTIVGFLSIIGLIGYFILKYAHHNYVEKYGPNEYTAELYCDKCDEETEHKVMGRGYSEVRYCTRCKRTSA